MQTEVWLLTATMYGLVSAGRKWQRASDNVMVNGLGLITVWGLPQLFYRDYASVEGRQSQETAISGGRDLCLIVAKYVDDLLVAGRNDEWLQFAHDGVSRAFELSSWASTPDVLIVNTSEVLQTPQDVTVSMHAYLKEVDVISISAQRRKELDSEVTRIEQRRLKSIAGKLGYLGVTVSPFAAFAASFIQQLVPSMRVIGMKKVNALVRDILRRQPVLSYIQPSVEENAQARIVVFSDAGFPHDGSLKKVAQEGCVVGISFGVSVGSIFHTITYQSRKQRRVATSTGEAETIAAVTAIGCARALKDSVISLTGRSLGITLVVDSKGLHRCLATQSLPRDRGMSADVHRLRAEYESGDIADIVWVPGVSNPADGLTKPISGITADLLEKMLVEGRLPIGISDKREYGPALREEL